VVPELLQSNAKPESLCGALADWLASPDRMRPVQAKFRDLHQLLQRDTARLATDAIEKVLAS
jgi:lipid-A-disaccharide synthase